MNSGYINTNNNKAYDYSSLSINTTPQNNNNTVNDESQNKTFQAQYKDNRETANNTSGRIPNNAVSFGDELPELSQIETPNNSMDNSNDLPALSEIAPNSDPNDLPSLDQLIGQEPDLAYNDSPNEEKEANKDHSTSKAILTTEWGLARNFISKKATNVITKAVEQSVTQAVFETLGKASVETVAETVVKKGAKKGAKKVAEKIVEQVTLSASEAVAKGVTSGSEKLVAELAKTGQLGKGVASVTLRESGGVINAVKTGGSATVEILTKEIGEQGLAKGASSIIKKTIIGGGEQALEKGIKTGMEKASKNIIEKATAQGLDKATVEAVEKATVESSTKAISKTSVKVASTSQKILTGVNIAVSTGITIWDTVDAINKSKDENTSVASRVLAWSTVGLDAVSTVATATGKGRPLGTVAGFVSIGTSVLSDIVRYKK